MIFSQNSLLSTKLFIVMTILITLVALMTLIAAWINLKKKKTKILTTYQPPSPQPKKPTLVVTSQDIKAIAGDNVMSTQLDLAKAYIEMDKKNMAKKILAHVLKNGDKTQQIEAQNLMSALELA